MTDGLDALGEPGEVLRALRAATIAQSASDMERLYAPDAVQEFPFTLPGLPTRLDGRDAIMEFATANWGGPLRYERYETLLAHSTDDPLTIVVQQDVHGTSATTGPFVLPNLFVLTAAEGQVRHLRDFVNIPAAFAAMGQPL